MKQRDCKILVGDFETTVYNGQTRTDVWASALVELYTEDVVILGSIADTFKYLTSLKRNVLVYYHNLKFDGSFWLDYLMFTLKLTQAVDYLNEEKTDVKFKADKYMENGTYKYSISDKGMFYNILIKYKGYFIEIRDSYKLLPFSVKKIGKSFGTKHKKLDMEYKGVRYPNCYITPEEKEYIKNDVLVVKEALEIMYNDGHNKLTIGSCCLSEFKKGYDKLDYKNFFPDITSIKLEEKYNATDADHYIRRSYKGGWCYVVKGKECKIYKNGTTADVNSLYPSVMHSSSGNYYPVGLPCFWHGNYIPDDVYKGNRFFFITIKTRFYIKKNKLPFIQIKGNYLYRGTEYLETSDVYDYKTERYYDHYYDSAGKLNDTRVTLTLTQTDYKLLLEHYELVDFEILHGCWFYSEIGLFDNYINKYKEIKMNSKGAKREEAKLFLNNLYGKMASSTDSSFKFAIPKDNNSVGFISVRENEKHAGYIPIGSAITSYARNFTIRAAQKNYHGVDKAGFIYADTDSIHCDLSPEKIVGIKTHDSEFNCWKLESCWDIGFFTRQKTYIEHVTHEDLEPVEPYYNVKCAGMPQHCKDLFIYSMCGYNEEQFNVLNEEEQEFVKEKRNIEDFVIGLSIPGKLRPARIPGGIVLAETTYKMR